MDFRLKDVGDGFPDIARHVSILVLMDFRLKENQACSPSKNCRSFNPCSNGLSAQRRQQHRIRIRGTFVSILVLMDFRLKEAKGLFGKILLFRFNPCSNGLSAQRIFHQDKGI